MKNQKLTDFWESLTEEQKLAFASKCFTTYSYLKSAKFRDLTLGPVLCSRIETESNGQVTRKDLRPDDWHVIWPELKPNKSA